MTTNPRFSLRFDSGERQGDLVPVPPGGFVVGRRPGSSLQVLDSSVSGKHAELIVDSSGCLLRDLGSTNGTRINGTRVLEEHVSQGDEILFGNIQFTVQEEGLAPQSAQRDSGLRGRAKAEGVARAAVDVDTGEDVGGVSAEMLERAGKSRGSKLGLLVGLLVLGGGGAALWFLNRGGGGAGGGDEKTARVVEEVPGNLAPDPSFEGDGSLADWEQASAAFSIDSSAAYSGDSGLVAELEAGDWALATTEAVALRGGVGALEVRAAFAFFESGAEGRVGLQFLRDVPAAGEDDEPLVHSLWSWSAPVSGSEDFTEASYIQSVPSGFQRVRVALLGQAKGNVAAAVYADDLVLLPVQESASDERLVLLGGEPSGAFLSGGDDALPLYGLHCSSPPRPANSDGEIPSDVPGLGFALEAGTAEFGGNLAPRGAGSGPAIWTGRIDGELAAQGLASIGESGYQAHAGPFQRKAVSELLLGKRSDLISLRFASPVEVELLPTAGGLLFRATCPSAAAATLSLKLEFTTERAAAGDLAYEARKAQSAGELGAGLLLWTRLLDEAPYDAELVAEAEAQRSVLARGGLEEVQSIRELLDRARFFRLADLYGRARDDAGDLAGRYVGTEVEVAARELERAIASESSALEQDRSSLERGRLERIHAGLVASDAQDLAQQVQKYLEESF